MTHVIHIDFETRAKRRLGKTKHPDNQGLWKYMKCPYLRALIASYRIDDQPLKRWQYGQPCPDDIRRAIAEGAVIIAHNAAFERLLWQLYLTPKLGWPTVRREQFKCTAAKAAALGLPRDLDGLSQALDLKTKKLGDDGKRLIDLFSVPRRARKGEDKTLTYFNEPEEFPADFNLFINYCDYDVLSESEADERMVSLSDATQQVYQLSELINDRGLRIDMPSVRAALRIARNTKTGVDAAMHRVTGGAVRTCASHAALKKWLEEQGLTVTSTDKATVADLLEMEDLALEVREALELKQNAKSSVSKLEKFEQFVDPDTGRVHHAFVFNAASTGRFSSRGVQLHNMPRPRKEFIDAHLDLDQLFDFIGTGDPGVIEFMYGPQLGKPLHLLSDALKSFVIADEGKELCVADYSGIEDAVGSWSAGEQWALKAMAEILADPKNKPDMYRLTATGIYGEPIEKSDPRRQVGKVSRLALQYEGGVPALFSMARNYNLKLHTTYGPVWSSASEERRERACKRYEKCLRRNEAKTDVLSREGWIAGELIKIGYRETHPNIRDGWGILRNAIREAVLNPGTEIRALNCTYLVAQGFLWCRLPSGRCLAYASPRLKQQVWFYDFTTEEAEVVAAEQGYARERAGEGRVKSEATPAVTALGVNSVTLAFERFGLYGGLAFENIVQAIALDLLNNGLLLAEAAGYPVIGHIHDEIITEVMRGFDPDAKRFEKLICQLPVWAAGLPLGSSGYSGSRLKKD